MTTTSERAIRVRQNEEEPFDSLPELIAKVSAGVERLLKSGFNRKAIIVLIADDTKLGKREIETVLDSLRRLHERYCSK